jgi:hypothetical protein
MEQTNKPSNRKKFLLWGAAVLSVITLSRFFPRFTNKNNAATGENKTVKMLTQDGQLVEVDRSLLTASGKKITNEELQQWVNKKTR